MKEPRSRAKGSPPATETPADYVSRPALLARGWTRSLVNRLLGGPDYYVANPHGPTLPQVGLFSTERVLKAQASPGFAAGQRARRRPPAA